MIALRLFVVTGALAVLVGLTWVSLMAATSLNHRLLMTMSLAVVVLIGVPLIPLIYSMVQIRQYRQLMQVTGRVVPAEEAEGTWKAEDLLMRAARSPYWHVFTLLLFAVIIGYKLLHR